MVSDIRTLTLELQIPGCGNYGPVSDDVGLRRLSNLDPKHNHFTNVILFHLDIVHTQMNRYLFSSQNLF